MIDQLLQDLRSNNVRIWAKEGRLHFDAPKDAMTPEVLALLRGNKEGLLRRLEEGTGQRRRCGRRCREGSGSPEAECG